MKTSLSPEVKRLIEEKVSSGRYRSADEVVLRGLTLLQKDEERALTGQSSGGDLPALFESVTKDVPEADWQSVPADLSKNLDHYLYGAQKSS